MGDNEKTTDYGLDAAGLARLHSIKERVGVFGPRERYIADGIRKGWTDEALIGLWRNWLGFFGGDENAAGAYMHGDEANYFLRPLNGQQVIKPGEEGRPAVDGGVNTKPTPAPTDDRSELTWDVTECFRRLHLLEKGTPFGYKNKTQPLDLDTVQGAFEIWKETYNAESMRPGRGRAADIYRKVPATSFANLMNEASPDFLDKGDPNSGTRRAILLGACYSIINMRDGGGFADQFIAMKSPQEVLDREKAADGGGNRGPSGGGDISETPFKPQPGRPVNPGVKG